MKEENEKSLEFYCELKNLLTKPLKVESPELAEQKENVEYLKWKLKQLIEGVHKLDLFVDDLSLDAFIKVHVELPVSRFIEQQEKPWLSDKLTIGLMGHYNTGKTSALNCVFDEKFPVSPLESTALATYLAYGEKTDIVRIVDKSGMVLEIPEGEAGIFDHTKAFGFPFARVFDYLEKESLNPALQELTFIDTPGLFSYNTEHSAPTYKAIAHCDVVFWFVRVDRSLDQISIEYIKKFLGEAPIYFVMTFTDKRGVSDPDGAIEVILQKAKESGIKIEGYLKYGQREETQTLFKEEFNSLIGDLTRKYEKYHPLLVLITIINSLREMLVNRQSTLKKAISKLNKDQNKILNTFQTSQSSFVSAHSSLMKRFNSMINTFNTRCAGSMFCGSADSALLADINQNTISINNMTEAYNEINYDNLVNYGEIMSYISELEEENLKIENLKNEFNELLNLISND